MRLIIFTNKDLSSNLMLNHILPQLSENTVQIFVSDKVGGKPKAAPPRALQEMKFLEQTLPNTILFPQLDNQKRDFIHKLLTFNELSEKYNVPIASLNDVKSEESLAKIAALKPDLVLSIRYGKIFGNEFLKIPRLGVVNFHSGKLPNYRGVLAIFRALMNDDKEINGTLHYIDDNTIDTGGIIGFSTLKVDKTKSLMWHILNLYPASADLVIQTIKGILAGNRPDTLPQDASVAAYYTFPTENEVKAFQDKGWHITDVTEYEAFITQYL